jgi:hypothetical protein
MKDAKREFVLEHWFVKQVEAQGGLCLKMNQIRGIPDRLVLFPGKPPAFVELKALWGILSPIQKAVIAALRRKGFQVYEAYTKEELLIVLKSFE